MARRQPPPFFSGQISTIFQHTVFHGMGRCAPGETWSPDLNVYQLPGRLEVSVDLAGIDREAIHVQVEPGRLLIHGVRQPPEPASREEGPMRILSMEIDSGPFCREIAIPSEVRLDQVESSYENGLLWIRLPLRSPDQPR